MQDFHQIVNKILSKEQKKLCQSILDLPLFKDFSMVQMRRLIQTSKQFYYNRHQRVLEQNKAVEYVYVVLRGEFSVNRKSLNIQQLVSDIEQEMSPTRRMNGGDAAQEFTTPRQAIGSLETFSSPFGSSSLTSRLMNQKNHQLDQS